MPGAANSVAVSRDGRRVFVTGQSQGPGAFDYATAAYNAATGAQRWAKRYNGPANGTDRAYSVAVSPAKDTLFVTGFSAAPLSGLDYTLHLPEGWHREQEWHNLFEAATGPPAHAA